MQDTNDNDIAVDETSEALPQEGQVSIDLLTSRISELEDRLLRSVADLQNLQKRAEKERVDSVRYSVSSFARDILTIRDNLGLALDNCPDESNAIVDGIKLTITEMDKVLANYGINQIESLEKEFDPHLHQALVEIEVTDQKPGLVVRVMQEGFMIHDRLLRPALVGVSKNPPAASTSSE
ncbi:MAG: nucleotide exchange factor GrpE [Holosporales bacterium]|jgi:molecular chaperone GrpE|nr:nucleotide exchange factor GrpE [Holosporales bacterium]